VKLSVVPCPPVVEVLVKRPDVKYQLGFSVQNGVVCIKSFLLGMDYGIKCHFQQYLSYILEVSFIGGGNWSTRRKLLTCRSH